MALQKYSGLPKNKIVGMAGILDSSRFILFSISRIKSTSSKNSIVCFRWTWR